MARLLIFAAGAEFRPDTCPTVEDSRGWSPAGSVEPVNTTLETEAIQKLTLAQQNCPAFA